MTDDIVVRLRAAIYSAPDDHPVHPSICDEAADEIERLHNLLYEAWPSVYDAVYSGHPERRSLLEKLGEFTTPLQIETKESHDER